MAEAEKRIDPEDGKARTFDELVQHYKSVYTFQEVQQYWDNRCRPDIPTDPFLTSLQQPGPEFKLRPDQPPTAPASQVNLGPVKLSEDPFLAASFNQAKHPPALSQVHQTEVGAYKESAHWSETVSSCLGAGDVNRQPRARTALIMVPIFLYIWELLVWSLVSHITRNGCWLITITLFIVSAAAIAMWFQGIRWGPVSLAALGVLCILAIVGGTVLGQRGWDQLWRQFFWLNTGNQLVPTLAGTAAAARSDAASLIFGTAASGSLDHSFVHTNTSVGFKDTNLFCVAPVLSPDTAGADFPRVNYWAVGIDCCTLSGVFDCDASKSSDAYEAVVQLGGGYPCPSCNVETFQKAIAKAEATYGLVSAPDAVLIRWVANANKVKFQAAGWAIGYLLICLAMGSGFLFLLGYLSWYYGLGKRTPSGAPSQSYGTEDPQAAKEKRQQ